MSVRALWVLSVTCAVISLLCFFGPGSKDTSIYLVATVTGVLAVAIGAQAHRSGD